MRTANFNSWADFREYGINFLTGEACAFSMRLLCDLSEKGQEVVTDFLGLPSSIQLAPSWNSHVGEAPAVASVMLPRGLFQELARFIAFAVLGHKYVVIMPDSSVHSYEDGYIESNGLTLEKAKSLLQGDWYTNCRSSSAPQVGSRNVHAATGRAY